MAGCAEEKHGAYGIHARKKYSDCRSREGKQLRDIMNGIILDLGGEDKLNTGQRLILKGIRSKIIITQQISKYIDEQNTSLVGDNGELSPILRDQYNTYAESIRRDIETLYLMKRSVKHSDYERAVKSMQGKD